MPIRDSAPVRILLKVLPKFSKTTWAIWGLIAVFILFGDLIWPLIGHGLFLVMEFSEEGIETVLELAFGMTTREAQIVIVWVMLPVLFYFSGRIFRRPINALKRRWRAFRHWISEPWNSDDWAKVIFFIVLLTGFLFFNI